MIWGLLISYNTISRILYRGYISSILYCQYHIVYIVPHTDLHPISYHSPGPSSSSPYPTPSDLSFPQNGPPKSPRVSFSIRLHHITRLHFPSTILLTRHYIRLLWRIRMHSTTCIFGYYIPRTEFRDYVSFWVEGVIRKLLLPILGTKLPTISAGECEPPPGGKL